MVLLFVFVGLGAVVFVLGIVGWAVYRGTQRARSTTTAVAPATATPTRAAVLPSVTRRVPHHPLSILDGCSPDDVSALVESIDQAISLGAPLYNSGNFAGCYHLYEGAAVHIERKLSSTCAGPTRALETGRTRAASLEGAAEQAWAMRDAFDGLTDVVERAAR